MGMFALDIVGKQEYELLPQTVDKTHTSANKTFAQNKHALDIYNC